MEPVCNKAGRVAGIDVHKKMLAVVVLEREQADQPGQQRKFGTDSAGLRELREWLQQQQVEEAAMESTAQYWRSVWLELEGKMRLHLAQPRSTTAPKGRKTDFRDARRIVKRLLADDLTLSYVPGPEQRLERMLSRTRIQLIEERTRVRHQMECLLEEGRIKLAAVVSDLLGKTSRTLLRALAQGKMSVEEMAVRGASYLDASVEQLRNALSGSLHSLHRQVLEMQLERVEALDQQIEKVDQRMAELQRGHQAALERLSAVPGYNVTAAQQVIAEVGVAAETFASSEKLSSWMGACPGREESAEKSKNNRCPKGNRPLRRILTQVAWASVKMKGTVFHRLYHRLVPRLGKHKAIWAVVHKHARITWKLLHDQVDYHEYGDLPATAQSRKRKQQRLLRQLRHLGFTVTVTPAPA